MSTAVLIVMSLCVTGAAAQHTSSATVTPPPLFSYAAVVGFIWLVAVAACAAWRSQILCSGARQAREMRDVVLKEVVVDAAAKRPPIPTTPISRAEVAKHNKKTDCWIVVHNLVLDVTEYMPLHPGGERTISVYAGGDATDCYDSEHYPDTIELYAPEVIIGQVSD